MNDEQTIRAILAEISKMRILIRQMQAHVRACSANLPSPVEAARIKCAA